jgi:hypothetical protein
MILDRYGEVIYYHVFPEGDRGNDFKIQPDGMMSYSESNDFVLLDSTFSISKVIHYQNNLISDGHDFQIMSNGHFLFIGAENIQMDLSAYYMFLNNGSPGSADAKVRCMVIQELDTNENVVFEWHAKDYFPFEDTEESRLTDTAKVDWNHANAVEEDFDGNLLVSIRRFNEITKINRSDSSIIWRLGGKKNQFTFFNDPVPFIGQHDIGRLAGGHITMFDNGTDTIGHPATAREYELDESLLQATLKWYYVFDSSKYSYNRENLQRLSNGNAVIGYGDLSNDNIIFNCIDSTGNPIIEVRSPDSLLTYRAFNYPTLPWSLNRPLINCINKNGHYFLSVDSGLGTYYWNTGDTVYETEVLATGYYDVFVPRGAGGFIRSEKFFVNNLVNPCSAASVNSNDHNVPYICISPNPVRDLLVIDARYAAKEKATIEIMDITNKLLITLSCETGSNIDIPVEWLPSGLYFLKIQSAGNSLVKKFIKY